MTIEQQLAYVKGWFIRFLKNEEPCELCNGTGIDDSAFCYCEHGKTMRHICFLLNIDAKGNEAKHD